MGMCSLHSGSRNPLNKVLEAYREVEAYRLMFRLPCDEMLDGYTECAFSCPSLKMDVLGKMYISPHYICFASKVRVGHWQACGCMTEVAETCDL